MGKQSRLRGDEGTEPGSTVINIFALGQAHVALSRVRNLEGVKLTGLQRSKLHLIDTAMHEEYARLALCHLSS